MTHECESHDHTIHIIEKGSFPGSGKTTARLTILIDPRKKEVFERLRSEEDSTPSQVVRRLMRAYIESRTGKPWSPEAETKSSSRRKNG
jgi:hypothetical protein